MTISTLRRVFVYLAAGRFATAPLRALSVVQAAHLSAFLVGRVFLHGAVSILWCCVDPTAVVFAGAESGHRNDLSADRVHVNPTAAHGVG